MKFLPEHSYQKDGRRPNPNDSRSVALTVSPGVVNDSRSFQPPPHTHSPYKFLKLGSYAQFAPRVYFWPCERCFKNLHPGANLLLLLRWSKFICTRVHMNAKCLFSIRFDREFCYIADLF